MRTDGVGEESVIVKKGFPTMTLRIISQCLLVLLFPRSLSVTLPINAGIVNRWT